MVIAAGVFLGAGNDRVLHDGGWSGLGGITYTVAVYQSGLALGVIVVLAFIIRRPWLLFLVPLLSAVLSIALGVLGAQMGETGV